MGYSYYNSKYIIIKSLFNFKISLQFRILTGYHITLRLLTSIYNPKNLDFLLYIYIYLNRNKYTNSILE